jgi:hypothetical protein
MMAELGSRVDDIIHFQPLDDVSMSAIVQQQLQLAVEAARQQGVLLQVHPEAAVWLAAAGCSATQGARPLMQLIRRHVLVPLAAAVMQAVAGGVQGDHRGGEQGHADGWGYAQADGQQKLGRDAAAAAVVGGAGAGDGVWAVATVSMAAPQGGSSSSAAAMTLLQLHKL